MAPPTPASVARVCSFNAFIAGSATNSLVDECIDLALSTGQSLRTADRLTMVIEHRVLRWTS